MTRYTTRDGLPSDDIHVIAEDAAGDLWAGFYGGLARLHAGSITRWTEREGLPSNTVRALYFDADGVLWIGTYDGGLGRYKDGRFARITQPGWALRRWRVSDPRRSGRQFLDDVEPGHPSRGADGI